MDEKAIARFWSKVDRRGPGECWEWTAGVAKKRYGYGMFWVRGKMIQAHRFALIASGVDVHGWNVLHSCDNPPCCNPAHLRRGTQADNVSDMCARGRKSEANKVRGEASHLAKLTASDVRAIRAAREAGVTLSGLAERYGVRVATVWDIAKRRSWRHIA